MLLFGLYFYSVIEVNDKKCWLFINGSRVYRVIENNIIYYWFLLII